MKTKNLIALILVVLLLITCMACGQTSGDNKSVVTQDANKDVKDVETQKTEQKNEEKSMEEGGASKQGFPLTEEKITLRMLANKYSTHKNWEEMYVWKKYEEMTNVHIEWQLVPSNNFAERRNILLATGGDDMPDAIFKAGMNLADLMRYGEQGVIIPLNPMMDEYAPNFTKLLEENPEIKKGLTMLDGKIYGTPYIGELLSPRIPCKLFINKVWMEQLGLDMLKTTDDFYNLLKAIRDNDCNGNGDPNDEIPLGGAFDQVHDMLAGAWGLKNRGTSHPYVDWDESKNDLRFFPITEEYRDLLKYLNKLYTEKLMDEEAFTLTAENFVAKAEQDLYGTFTRINHTFVGQKLQDNFEGVAEALVGPNDVQMFTGVNPSIYTPGAFVITNVNKYPELTMRWIDYFYGEEGIELYFMGEKGVTYETDEDGNNYYLEVITKNPDGLSYDQAQGLYVCWGGGGNPSIVRENYFPGPATLPISMEAANRLAPYIPETVWEEFAYSVEENEIMSALKNDIHTYVKETTAKFVTGESSLDNDWDNYIKTLNNMGLEEYMKLYKTAYERYNSK